MPEEEVLAYHERCKATCQALNLELVGFTPGKGFNYNVPEFRLNSSYGDHEMPHAVMERLENLLKK